MNADAAEIYFTLFSPASFLILAISKAWLRLALFLPLAAAPPALLLYVLIAKIDNWTAAGHLTIMFILSVVFTLLGFAMMVKAERKTKPFAISVLGTIVASTPLTVTVIAFVGVAIYKMVTNQD